MCLGGAILPHLPLILFLVILFSENVDIRTQGQQGITFPISPNDRPLASYRFSCELPYGTENFSSYWILPTGEKIVANDSTPVMFANGKYILDQFLPDVNSFFPPSSFLTVNNLLYSDAGEFTCHVTFTDTNTTASDSVLLTLNGMHFRESIALSQYSGT